MKNVKRLEEVAQTDAFLAQEKFLLGPPPLWNRSDWAGEYVAVWNVTDADGAAIAVLQCNAQVTDTSVAGINAGQELSLASNIIQVSIPSTIESKAPVPLDLFQ